MRKLQESCQQVDKKSWDSNFTVMRQSWDSHETVIGQSWDSHEKVMRHPWDSHETVMRQTWGSLLLYSSCRLCRHVCSCLFVGQSVSQLRPKWMATRSWSAFQPKAMLKIKQQQIALKCLQVQKSFKKALFQSCLALPFFITILNVFKDAKWLIIILCFVCWNLPMLSNMVVSC